MLSSLCRAMAVNRPVSASAVPSAGTRPLAAAIRTWHQWR
jgi:hypothetical protein